jgi:shikimate kinase
MNNIYLVGFMATGKSIVGKELAKKLRRKFVDLDALIELKEKRRICDIFAENGEPYFRKLEKATLRKASTEDNFIYACGGGIVIDEENIRLMQRTGKIICLSAKPEVILKRAGGTSQRPLLNVPDPKKQIRLLLKSRQPFYRQADVTIDTSRLSIVQVASQILKSI